MDGELLICFYLLLVEMLAGWGHPLRSVLGW